MDAKPTRPARNDVSQASGGETRTTETVYDAAGNVEHVISPLQQTTSYAHDPNGRVTSATGPDNHVWSFLHDPAGNVTGVVPPGPGGDHHFAYNSRDLVPPWAPAALGPGDEATYHARLQAGLGAALMHCLIRRSRDPDRAGLHHSRRAR